MFYYTAMIMLLGYLLRMLLLLLAKWDETKARIVMQPQALQISDTYSSLIHAYANVERMHAIQQTLQFVYSFYRGEIITLQLQVSPVENHEPHPTEALLHDAIYQYVFWDKICDHEAIKNKKGFDKLPALIIQLITLQSVAVRHLKQKDSQLLREWLSTLTNEQRVLINWRKADFSELNLRDANLSYGIYLNTNFSHSLLEQANFTGAYFNELAFSWSSLIQTNFSDVTFNMGQPYELKGAALDASTYAALHALRLDNFQYVTFMGNFVGGNFSGLILDDVRFERGILTRPIFSDASIQRIFFESAPIAPNLFQVQVSPLEMMRKIETKILKHLSDPKAIAAMKEYHVLLTSLRQSKVPFDELKTEDWQRLIKSAKSPNLEWVLSSSTKKVLSKFFKGSRPHEHKIGDGPGRTP